MRRLGVAFTSGSPTTINKSPNQKYEHCAHDSSDKTGILIWSIPAYGLCEVGRRERTEAPHIQAQKGNRQKDEERIESMAVSNDPRHAGFVPNGVRRRRSVGFNEYKAGAKRPGLTFRHDEFTNGNQPGRM